MLFTLLTDTVSLYLARLICSSLIVSCRKLALRYSAHYYLQCQRDLLPWAEPAPLQLPLQKMSEVQTPAAAATEINRIKAAKTELLQAEQQEQVNGKDDSELTEEDKRLIRADWALARQDLQTVATKLFIVFFIQNPTYPEMFRWAKGTDVSSWNINTPTDALPKRMPYHSLAAAKQISVIVDNLDDPEGLEALFTTIGQQHVGRNVTPAHWERFNIALLTLLRELLTPAGYDDKHEKAWKKALQVITDASLRAIELATGTTKNGQPTAAANGNAT